MFDGFSQLLDWLRSLSWYQALALSVGLFLVGFFGSIAMVSWILVRLPSTYFSKNRSRTLWVDSHPALRWSGIVAKNLLGVVLVGIGIILALPGVPGQGVLTILIGIMLLDFPGKRHLEQKLVSRPVVLRAINRLRDRWGKPPLVLDEN